MWYINHSRWVSPPLPTGPARRRYARRGAGSVEGSGVQFKIGGDGGGPDRHDRQPNQKGRVWSVVWQGNVHAEVQRGVMKARRLRGGCVRGSVLEASVTRGAGCWVCVFKVRRCSKFESEFERGPYSVRTSSERVGECRCRLRARREVDGCSRGTNGRTNSP